MAGAELGECGGQDGAFEVEMKLGLGEPADEVLNFGHTSSLAGHEAWFPRSPSAECAIRGPGSAEQTILETLSLALDFSGFVVDEGDGPFLAGLVKGDGAVAVAAALGVLVMADGHLDLQFAHAG